MAPYIPEEVNVFSVPHSRMKELVNSYFELIQSTNFSNTFDLEMLLESLYRTFTEFKSHEQIENKLIVRKLRTKMRMLSVNNTAVCNCHKGSRLSEMIRLLEDGFSKITDQDRINYGIKLQKELMEFTNDSFLPHMKEEEEVFQPLLLEYFSYEELCHLKQKVIQQHLAKKEAQKNGLEKSAWADREAEGSIFSTSSESEEDESKVCLKSTSGAKVTVKLSILDLPPELILKVFQYLSPRELCRCALVCHRLNRMAMDHSLWKCILPIQWSRGNFNFVEAYHGHDDIQEGSGDESEPADEDADVDESEENTSGQVLIHVFSELHILDAVITHLLPKVGLAVEKLVLANGRKITDKLVRKLLSLCPNVKYIDLAQTNISDAALISLGRQGFASKLTTLILSGCPKITDKSLVRLALCLRRASSGFTEDFEDFSLSCWFLCDQYLEMHQCHPGYIGTSVVQNGKISQLKQLCGKNLGSVKSVSVNHAKCASGLYRERKKLVSCSALDSCEPFKVQYGATTCQKRSVLCSVQTADRDRTTSEKNRGGMCHPGKQPEGQERMLELLDLSGCICITDAGLSALFRSGHFPFLSYLDLSGCMQITAVGLSDAVAASPSLLPSNFFYCDNIIDGPFADEASGCRNLECSHRACCRSGN